MNRILVPFTSRHVGFLLLFRAFDLALFISFGADRSEAVQAASFATPGNHPPLSDTVFVAFDTETTGLSPIKDRIVELGAVKFCNGVVLETKSWLIHPGRNIPYRAKEIHGIDDDVVKDEPSFKEIYPNFEQFIDGTVLIAHNASFDIAFISEELKRNHLNPPPNAIIDSLSLFRVWYPESDSYTLKGLCTYLKIDPGGLHRALADSLLIFRILSKGLDTQDAVHTLGVLQESVNRPMKFTGGSLINSE